MCPGGWSMTGSGVHPGAGGQDMYDTWSFTAIGPHRRIEFVSHFADRDGRIVDWAEPASRRRSRECAAVVTLADLGDGRTASRLTESGYPTDAAATCPPRDRGGS